MKKRSLILAFGLILLVTAGVVGAQNSSGGFLGVRLQDSDDGVVIREIVENSPASTVLQVDDLITAINGEAVSSAAEVAAVVQAAAPGDAVTLTITRGGESQEIEVELGSAPPIVSVEPGQEFGSRRGSDGSGMPFQMMDTVIIYNPQGVWEVRMLTEGTPLYEAGLREGDVIAAFDGEALDIAGLSALVAASDADATVTLTVEHDGADQEIVVPAAALATFYSPMRLEGSLPVDPRGIRSTIIMASNGHLGVTFVTLNEQSAAENDVEFVEGALIGAVEAASPAAEAGVQVGDIVTAVNSEPVDQERTLRDRLFAYEPGDVVTLTVLRAGESMDIEVTLGEQPAQTFIMPGMPGTGFQLVPPETPATPEPLMPEATVVPGA